MNHIEIHEVVEARQPSPCAASFLPTNSHRVTTEPFECHIAVATPSPTNQRSDPDSEMLPLSILATSSPEIETLCQKTSLEFFERPNSFATLEEQNSVGDTLREFDFSNAIMMSTNQTKTPAAEKRHIPRVSLSPPRDVNNASYSFASAGSSATPFADIRSPLDDITRSLCRVRLTTPASSGLRSTISPARGPSQLRKPSLHRRVSFDMLPSPSEYVKSSPSPAKAARSASLSQIPTSSGRSPLKGARRHRRNTTVIVLSSRK